MEKPKIVSLVPFPVGVVQLYVAPFLEGKEVEVVGYEKTDEESLAELIKDADIVLGDFTFNIPITRKMVEGAKKLKLIQQPSVGYEHIDIKSCAEFGIPVANTAGANDLSVAEHTIMMAMALLKKLLYSHARTSQGYWVQMEMFQLGVFELYEKNWGIIGMGKIGKELAKRLKPFGVNILYFDKFRLSEDMEKEFAATYCPLEKLLREADIFSLHLPLTEETKSMIGEKELSLMKPTAILINTARGELVDEKALSNALKTKILAGAGLDVFSQEPIASDNPLLGVPNTILTSHTAGATNESRMRIINQSVVNVVRVLNGEKPLYVVNGVE